MDPIATVRCLLVSRSPDGQVSAAVEAVDETELPLGDVEIRVAWSSLNYKDAMAATGHPGIVHRFPHVPGIDAAGHVVASHHGAFSVGDPVLVTGYDLGAGRWGGWSERIRVPADWVVPLPAGLTLLEAMCHGTAGFTAALCVRRLQAMGLEPVHGPVVVSGASGGVGCLSVRLLAHLGFEVVASTGKATATDMLLRLGAAQVVDRNELVSPSRRPLLSTRWAGGIDTVGGETLASILRETRPYGAVAACGMLQGEQLSLTVYPFILRAVSLIGISASQCPRLTRDEIWRQLAGEWKLAEWSGLVKRSELSVVMEPVAEMLAGHVQGRVVVQVAGD